MAKFSDPNYEILLEYFSKFVKVATGSQHSYLIGPNRTVASLGGVDTTLYEKTIDRGFVGHKFTIVEIEGNRFKMKYNGLESTFSLATSAVNISDEMYFRKDSFFHFWLSRQPQYKNYVNLERTFSFFGKIWPLTGFDNIYSIEFSGMKDFAVAAIPTHNQTINLVTFIQTYFDRVQHDIYTMTKTLWSLFDPREVDIKWLQYIAGIFGIEIDTNLDEQAIREWVENLIYLLKRAGTYNSIYIIGKLFLGKTKNVLNVYERWGEWCRQIQSLPENFRDYHFLEFYGIQPSGGAGSSWYVYFNPNDVPVDHIHVNNGPPPYPIHSLLGPPTNELLKSEDIIFNGGFEIFESYWEKVGNFISYQSAFKHSGSLAIKLEQSFSSSSISSSSSSISSSSTSCGDPFDTIEITIDHTKIDSDLTDFPILIKLSDSSGITNADLSYIFNCYFAFTNIEILTEDDESCYIEVEKWDPSSKEAWLWVKVPTISSSVDTKLDLRFILGLNNPKIEMLPLNSFTKPTFNVWDSYKAVYHFDEETLVYRPTIGTYYRIALDSAGTHDNNFGGLTTRGAVCNSVNQYPSDSLIGTDYLFYQVLSSNLLLDSALAADYWAVELQHRPTVANQSYASVEGFFKLYTHPGTGLISPIWFENELGYENYPRFALQLVGQGTTTTKLQFVCRDVSGGTAYTITGTTNILTNVWYYVFARYDAVSNEMVLRLNGSQEGIDTTPKGNFTSLRDDKILIGKGRISGSSTWYYFDGMLSEIRFSTNPLSNAWSNATYYSGLDNLVSYEASSESLSSSSISSTSFSSTSTSLETYIYQDVPTIPNDIYNLSFWTRGNGIPYPPSGGGRYSVYDLSNSEYIIPVTETGITGTTFSEITNTFVAPENCYKVRLQFWIHGKNVLHYTDGIYFDDISLVHEVRSKCDLLEWDCGSFLNYFEFTGTLLNCSVGEISTDTIALSAFKSTSTQTFALSGQNITGDFKSCAGILCSIPYGSSEIVFWALSNEINGLSDTTGNYIAISFFVDALGEKKFRIYENSESGFTESVWLGYQNNIPYYLTIVRTSSTLLVYVYDDERRNHENLIEVISRNLSSVSSYTVVHAVNSFYHAGYVPFTGQVFSIHLNDVNSTLSYSVSGYPVLTPHYIVEIDLSSEALGADYIISETLIRDLYKNWEYVRPVMKYAHYRELVSPIAKTNTSAPINLYDTVGNVGTLTTEFVGSRTPSAGDFIFGDGTYSYFQNVMSKTWTITHGLSATNLIVQAFKFINVWTEKLDQIFPEVIEIIDDQTVKLTFKESVRGIAVIAGPSPDFGITYEHTESIPSTAWSIPHNLTANTPSAGYPLSAGPLMMAWSSNFNIIPSASFILNPNTLEVSFITAPSGTALVKRSDFIYQQTSSSNTWIINHKLNDFVLVQTYDQFGEQIYPKKVQLITDNSCIVFFNKPQKGTAHIAVAKRTQIAFSGFDCDITGFGFCPDILGYWKVGTGTSEGWDAKFHNDLQSTAASGAYLDLYEDVNWWYLDFEVPPFVDDIAITEVGLFNFNGELIFYTKCSEIFKIKNVSTFFHYRIQKQESSSSSSSYSSSSSSSG